MTNNIATTTNRVGLIVIGRIPEGEDYFPFRDHIQAIGDNAGWDCQGASGDGDIFDVQWVAETDLATTIATIGKIEEALGGNADWDVYNPDLDDLDYEQVEQHRERWAILFPRLVMDHGDNWTGFRKATGCLDCGTPAGELTDGYCTPCWEARFCEGGGPAPKK